MAGRYDIKVKAGNTLTRTLRFKDSEGEAIDLTGSVMSLYVDTPTGRITRTTQDGTLDWDATAGTVTLRLSTADTRLLYRGMQSWYELERAVPGGDEDTLLEGYMIVEESINADSASN